MSTKHRPAANELHGAASDPCYIILERLFHLADLWPQTRPCQVVGGVRVSSVALHTQHQCLKFAPDQSSSEPPPVLREARLQLSSLRRRSSPHACELEGRALAPPDFVRFLKAPDSFFPFFETKESLFDPVHKDFRRPGSAANPVFGPVRRETPQAGSDNVRRSGPRCSSAVSPLQIHVVHSGPKLSLQWHREAGIQ